ncbi:glycine betaine ABC transporter substrate-binding protein [Aliiruegeria sabulilitoris]|uniref:glycine betaine ABC transporter substrate-binding protein n=1 Tax=Aliiruegeria sabulilitoris TaxID=1510458 RepID=UPI00082DF133|nr:glycine betaine ABC transporter substrate-binding protein [Aliiruegeria sabulilitoris]NDR57686.1 glycine/betaine ABC transporter substrate-binding protein [Pseudoruegeria sp. M32A2M]
MAKRLFRALIAALILGVSLPARAADHVAIGEPTWIGAQIMARLIGHIIEDRFDISATYVPRANAGIFAAMDLGRGEIDVHPDVWLPNQSSLVDLYVKRKGTVFLSSGSYFGRSGICLPRGYAERHDIHAVQELADPRLRGLLDTDGDGVNDIWIGEEGWASTNVHKVKLRDYGLETALVANTENEALYHDRMAQILADGGGAVFYCYTPHYVQVLFDLVMLTEPAHDPATYRPVYPDQDARWFELSHVASADRIKTVRVAYSGRLNRSFPEAAHFLSSMDMDASDLSDLILAVQVDGQKIDVAVDAWIAENPQVIDRWLVGAE